MSYYIYAKPETFQMTYKVNYYKALMRLIWVLILLVSNLNNVLGVCVWWLNISVPTWLCVALLMNLIVSFISAEVLSE